MSPRKLSLAQVLVSQQESAPPELSASDVFRNHTNTYVLGGW